MKNNTLLRLLLVTTASAMLGSAVAPQAVFAEAGQSEVVGVDGEGNPIYSTDGSNVSEPDEDWTEFELPKSQWVEIVLDDPQGQAPICESSRVVTVANTPNVLKVDWADSVLNDSTGKAKFTVKAEVSKTFTWNVSGSLAAEFSAAIFAKVTATINSGIAHSKTTTYGSSVDIDVPAKTRMKVDRGMWQEKFNWTVVKKTATCKTTKYSGTGQAPYRQAWHIYK